MSKFVKVTVITAVSCLVLGLVLMIVAFGIGGGDLGKAIHSGEFSVVSGYHRCANLEEKTESFSVKDLENFNLDLTSVMVEMVETEGDEVKVDYSLCNHFDVTLSYAAGTLKILGKTFYSGSPFLAGGSKITIYAPASFNLNLSTKDSAFKLSDYHSAKDFNVSAFDTAFTVMNSSFQNIKGTLSDAATSIERLKTGLFDVKTQDVAFSVKDSTFEELKLSISDGAGSFKNVTSLKNNVTSDDTALSFSDFTCDNFVGDINNGVLTLKILGDPNDYYVIENVKNSHFSDNSRGNKTSEKQIELSGRNSSGTIKIS